MTLRKGFKRLKSGARINKDTNKISLERRSALHKNGLIINANANKSLDDTTERKLIWGLPGFRLDTASIVINIFWHKGGILKMVSYLITNVRYDISLVEELKLGFLMRSVKNSVACLSGELVCVAVASYTGKGFEIIG